MPSGPNARAPTNFGDAVAIDGDTIAAAAWKTIMTVTVTFLKWRGLYLHALGLDVDSTAKVVGTGTNARRANDRFGTSLDLVAIR